MADQLKRGLSADDGAQTISERLVEKVDDELKKQIVHWTAYYVS